MHQWHMLMHDTLLMEKTFSSSGKYIWLYSVDAFKIAKLLSLSSLKVALGIPGPPGVPWGYPRVVPARPFGVAVQGSPLVPASLFGVGVQFAQVDPKLAQVESEFGSNLPNHPMAQVDAKLAQVDPKLAQICPSSPQPAAATTK